jgi:predicted ATPase
LEALYSHHRLNAGWQKENQLSDGTLRLIALFWMLLEGEGLLLLEEPELSLDEEVVRNLPRLLNRVSRATKKRQRQIIITTHSFALLSDKSIDGRWVIRIEGAHEGSRLLPPSEGELDALRAGISAGDLLLPQVHPRPAKEMALG